MSKADDINLEISDTFKFKRRKFNVRLSEECLLWGIEKESQIQILYIVPMENIISVVLNNDINSSTSSTKLQSSSHSFTINYAKKKPKSIWRHRTATFNNRDPFIISNWVNVLQNNLNKLKERPKKLLLFVNPFGGKKKALEIFDNYAKELFKIAGIEINLIVSQRSNQIKDVILEFDLTLFDGIVCVGGDGTFSEVINGLVLKACNEHNINPNDTQTELPSPKTPVGIIPAGSTDSIVYCLHGTSDPETSVLQIIFGDRSGLDLVSVYNDDKLLKLYASVLSYGYLGDIAKESEKHRWMGKKRYEYTGFKRLMANFGYEGEIVVCSGNEPTENPLCKCSAGCLHCKKSAETTEHEENCSELIWRSVKGKFFMVSGANISCACPRSPNGLSPYSHLGDGYVTLVLIRHTSFANNLKLLLTLTGKNKSIHDLTFVENYRAKEFCFHASSQTSLGNVTKKVAKFSRWNCDGEVLGDTNLIGKVRRQLVTVFTRGIQMKNRVGTI